MNFLSMCAAVSMAAMSLFDTVTNVVNIVLDIILATGVGALFVWLGRSGALKAILQALVG